MMLYMQGIAGSKGPPGQRGENGMRGAPGKDVRIAFSPDTLRFYDKVKTSRDYSCRVC